MKTNYFSRKLILSLAVSIALAASPALAHPWHGGHHDWHGHHGGGPTVGLGIAGALIGGALAYPSYAQPECWAQYDQWGQAYRVCR
jgi:hypothetical protein